MSRLPAAQRRTQLLDTAAQLFAERGYAKTTTALLAKAAGVTEPIIYRHFASKREMFIALIDRTGQDTIRTWEQQLADAPDPAERLRRLIGANPMVTDQGQGAYRVIVQAMTEIDDELIREALQRHMAALHRFVAEEIVRAQQAVKVSRRLSPEIIAWMLLHLGLGFGILAPIGVPGHARDESGATVRQAIESLLLGEG
ncbi:MAG: TetR/AcrR family transcriptional regulator [Phycisphaeraceae bacterium]|nr:TetR/AcrR family transcriptional regulator [Phycisphaeraceae bacterium]MCB9848339.1 TetR/AcrR family transcriptional regulator [Phycisphaeraceae bacterium]